MSDFDNVKVTKLGTELLTKAMNGDSITFTKVLMGSGAYTGDTEDATAIVTQEEEMTITGMIRQDNVLSITAELDLTTLNKKFYWKEVGLFAKGNDDVEILYLYGNCGDLCDYVSNNGLTEKVVNFNIAVSDAVNVNVTISPSISGFTSDDCKRLIKEHNDDMTAHAQLVAEVKQQVLASDTITPIANRLFGAHNSDENAHSDIREAYASELSDHNKSSSAHASLFSSMDNKISSSVSAHNASGTAHSDIRSSLATANSSISSIHDAIGYGTGYRIIRVQSTVPGNSDYKDGDITLVYEE